MTTLIKPKVIEVDGLQFEKSVWDPTPVEWNERGSWADDPELTARIIAGLTEALGGQEAVDAMVAEALTAKSVLDADVEGDFCRTYWGSHGCDRAADHAGLCVCTIEPVEFPDGTMAAGPCSALYKWRETNADGLPGGTAIVFWGDEEVGLRLGSLHWTWFQ